MPNYVQMISKETGEPVPFTEIDDAMRQHFDQPPSDSEWLWGWYDSFGLLGAMGKTWDEMRAIYSNHDTAQRVLDYLSERYDLNGWYQSKLRS